MFRLYNTLTRTIEDFSPKNSPTVTLYTCGPTVYWSTHIGHMSKYVRDDLLRRTLAMNGYAVRHVMNVTDVGHLVSDADEGDDKMEKGAKREGISVWDIAKRYEREFFDTMAALNVLPPAVVCRATEHISEQIALIHRLADRGYVYETDSAVYFDVSKFPRYADLSGQKLDEKMTGSRDDVVSDPQKKNPYDFAVWFKRVGRFADHAMHWDSPWGDGFPGWHIECSAMSMKYLGETIDIHTGGEDHVGVHHPAEIAQSEAATGKQFVRFWVHHAFLNVDGKKMSKSLENFYTLPAIREKGFEPLSLRYLFLTGHYRQPLNFTFEGLRAAQEALYRLREAARSLSLSVISDVQTTEQQISDLQKKFMDAVNEDLQTPRALAFLWNSVKDQTISPSARLSFLKWADTGLLGLDITPEAAGEVPDEIKNLAEQRRHLRSEGKFEEADKIRKEISDSGYDVEDMEGSSYRIKPRRR